MIERTKLPLESPNNGAIYSDIVLNWIKLVTFLQLYQLF